MGVSIWADLSAIGTGERVSKANGPGRGTRTRAGAYTEHATAEKDEVRQYGRARQMKIPILADRYFHFKSQNQVFILLIGILLLTFYHAYVSILIG